MKVIYVIALLLISVATTAQENADSFETKQVLLKEILITAGQYLPNNKEFKPSKNVQAGTDRVLESLPGISVIKRGSYAWEPGIRGLTGGRINVTIDGMAIFGACTDKMDPASSYIEPNNLKSITVSYGANEVTSGNNIGGGFDFRINQPVLNSKQKFSGMAGTAYESNGNALQMLTRIDYSDKRIGITVNGIYKQSENYSAGNKETVSFSQYHKWNGGIGVKYKVNNHNNLTLNYIHDDGYNIGYPALLMDVLYARADIVSLTHQAHIGKGILKKIENKVYYNRIDHAMDDSRRPDVIMHMDMPGNSETAGVNAVAHLEAGKHSIKAKLSAYQNRLHAEMTMYPEDAATMFMLTIPDAQRRYAEVSIHDELLLSKKWTLITGISTGVSHSSVYSEPGRHTLEGSLHNELNRTDGLYNLYFSPVYKISKSVSINLTAGYAMRTPTLQELYGFYLFNRMDGYDYMGNPSLRNESSWNFSSGVQAKTSRTNFEARAFTYLMRNYISGIKNGGFDMMTVGALGVKQYENLQSATLSGFEANISYAPWKNVTFVSNNSFSFGTDAGGNALANIPPFRSIGRLSLLWKQFRIDPEVIVSAAQRHVSKEMYGETATPSSTLLNFSIGRSFLTGEGSFSVNASVHNIFDRYYYDHNSIARIPSMGRSLMLQCNWTF